MWIHLVAHVKGDRKPLSDPKSAAWLWKRLRDAFPVVLGCTLMPDHVHLVMQTKKPFEAQVQLGRTLGGFSRWMGQGPVWSTVPEPSLIASRQKLARDLRYLALNPCREASLRCAAPLVWPWSTHRDVMGTVASPWVKHGKLWKTLRWRPMGFPAKWHAYVSSDPSVNVAGTEPPVVALPVRRPVVGLAQIAAAACAAHVALPGAHQKRGPVREVFLHLAREQGWRVKSAIGEECGLKREAIRAAFLRPPPPGLSAARLCLGTPRLTDYIWANQPKVPVQQYKTMFRWAQPAKRAG